MINKFIKFISENKNNSQGLLTGNAGQALFLCLVSRKMNDVNAEQLADNLIDEVFDYLEKNKKFTPVTFGDGLAGVGWCVEYLVEHKFCDGDTDHILEDIDNAVFRVIHEQIQLPLNLQQGLIGCLFYVISRLKNKDTKKLSTQINQGLLIKIINKIDEIAPDQFHNIGNEIQFNLLWQIPALFLALDQALDLNIHNRKITTMMEQWMFNLSTHLPGVHSLRLFLALSLYKINEKLKRKDIEKQIQILLYSIDFDVFRREIAPSTLNLQFGWYGTVLLLYLARQTFNESYPNYEKMEQLRREILSQHKEKSEEIIDSIQQLPLEKKVGVGQGLANGLSGIGMLYLLCPEALD